MKRSFIPGLILLLCSCAPPSPTQPADSAEPVSSVPAAQYSLTDQQTHNKFSSAIPPVLRVPSGAVVEVRTQEATDGQFRLGSSLEDMEKLDFDRIHALTGPVYIETAEPGDVLAVTLHEIELGDWAWTGVSPGFGFLAEEFTEPWLRTFELGPQATHVQFNSKIRIPVKPFPGVLGVAPATSEMLTTIPPRANGGNMDDPHIVVGTTVYLPVFVEGGLFSIGDTHAVQGMGEVCGTAVEAPMRIVYELEVIKNGPPIQEPQYENDDVYAVTAYATTLDEAAKKATRYMIDYLEQVHEMDRTEAYVLASLAGDLKIGAVVDVPHMLVAMHISKEILGIQ